MTYASVATGFKGGGVNPAIYRAEQIVPFGPEKLTAYEVGAKASLLDRHVNVDISGFFNKYDDIQLVINDGIGIFAPPANIPVNGGAADVKGIEAEVNASFGGFKADASFSALDFKYTYIRPGTGIQPGFITPYTPTTKWSVGAQYAIHLDSNDGLILTPRIDANYQSDIYSIAGNDALSHTSGYTLVNAHLKLADNNQNWSVDLTASNLLNKYYYTSAYSELYGLEGVVLAQVGPPRQISATLRYDF